jgi:hypothetical protein
LLSRGTHAPPPKNQSDPEPNVPRAGEAKFARDAGTKSAGRSTR